MNALNWKQRQKITPTPPRVIRKMQPSTIPAHSKAAMGRTSGRNKPEKTSKARLEQIERGRMKQLALIDRGIKLNSKPGIFKQFINKTKSALKI